MIISIEKNGIPFVLKPGQRITVKEKNSLLYDDALPKAVSLPFQLPWGTVNDILLSYAYRPENRADLPEAVSVTVRFSDGRSYPSLLKVTATNSEYAEAYLKLGADEATEETGNTSLNDLDFGTISLYQATQVVILRLALFGGSSFSPIVLKVDKYTYSVSWTTNHALTLAAIAAAINADTTNTHFTATSDATHLTLTAKVAGTPGTFSVQSTIEAFMENHPIITGPGYQWIIHDDTSWLNAHLDAWKAYVSDVNASTADTYDITFPLVHNPLFYNNQSAEPDIEFQQYDQLNYQEWMNDHILEDNELVVNLTDYITYDNRNTVVPFPYLKNTLRKAFALLGFQMKSQWLEDPEIASLTLWNLNSVDFPHLISGFHTAIVPPLIGARVNIFKSTFSLAECLPNITLKEFLVAVKQLFVLDIRYDYLTATVTVEPFTRQVKNARPIDFTHLTNPRVQLEPIPDRKPIKTLAWATDTADELKPLPDDPAHLYQKPYTVSDKGEQYTMKFASIHEALQTHWSNTPGNIILTLVPRCRQVGNSAVANLTNTAWMPRLLFFRGMHNGLGGIGGPTYAMAQATARPLLFTDPATGDYELSWQGSAGLYELYWKLFIGFILGGVQCRRIVYLNEATIELFRQSTIHRIDVMHAIWKDLEYTSDAASLITAQVTYYLQR